MGKYQQVKGFKKMQILLGITKIKIEMVVKKYGEKNIVWIFALSP